MGLKENLISNSFVILQRENTFIFLAKEILIY